LYNICRIYFSKKKENVAEKLSRTYSNSLVSGGVLNTITKLTSAPELFECQTSCPQLDIRQLLLPVQPVDCTARRSEVTTSRWARAPNCQSNCTLL